MRDASPERHILASAKGGGMLAGGQFFEMASRFVIAFLLARAIGASGYGLYNLALSAGALFAGLSALGLDDAMVRYVAIQTRRCHRRTQNTACASPPARPRRKARDRG